MVSLKTVGQRFNTRFQVVSGGSGEVRAELTETEQTSQPSYIFVQPRHILRVSYPTLLRPGMVVQSQIGSKFILGDNGPSETHRGTIWQSFRLFEPTGFYEWKRRVKTMDPITNTEQDAGQLQLIGMIWAALEPLDRMQFDREIHRQFEQRRFITGAEVLQDDLIDNHAITKVDKQLGISIGTLT